MTRIQELEFNKQTIRLASDAKRWWVFCEDVAPQIDAKLTAVQLYAGAPECERRILNTSNDSSAYLVSARHLLYWLNRNEATNHNKLRAWMNAWKIISDAAAAREASVARA